jgi:molybdopterin molybdotransferase
MLSYTEAQHIIKSFARSFGTEKVSLDDALGRVLAEKIIADRDYPPFNRAAMDGYAVRLEDFENGIKELKVIGIIYAGNTSDKVISAGECFKIMTGAAVPFSANAVIRREDAEEQNQLVSFSVGQLKPFQNIARRGEDLQKGIIILEKPERCNASVAGLLASIGKHEVLVKKLPSVAVITTGNEVVDVQQPVNDVQIRNSNFYVLKALLKSWGIKPSFSHHVLDNPDDVRSVIEKALQCDIVILNGGVSAGDADYVPSVLKQLGVEELFHKVAIRPGKPFWCGCKQNTMVFALPGNPLSCLVTFTVFIRYYLENCFGVSSSLLSLPIADERKQRVKLDEFFPVEIKNVPSEFYPVHFNGSGDIRLGFEAEAFAIHPHDKTVLKKGEIINSFLL